MDLKKLFNPSSIAIVGVSREPKKVGHLVAKNLLAQGYEGEVYFVNPNAERILGKKVYKDLYEIKKPIDLAVIALPVDLAIVSLEDLHAVGIKNMVLYAAGFKETDPEGYKKEIFLRKKAAEYGITILGPNCIGFINTSKKINTTFLKNISPKGNIGFVSQSGAIGAVLLDYFSARNNLGFSYFVSLGNKTIVDESSVLGFLADDENTKVIAMYLEDVTSGDKLRDTLIKVATKKPVIILKSGVTKEGAKAAISHTGGLVGDDKVFDAMVEGSGAIRANTYNQFIGLLKLYSFNRIPTSKKVLVLSNAGGVGVLLADQIINQGLELTTISHKTKDSLKKSYKENKKITLHNPIDLLGDASAFEYEGAINSTLKETDIGSIIVLLTPQANTEIPQTALVIKKVQEIFEKPIYPVFMGEKSIENSHLYFEKHKIASFDSYEIVPILIKKIIERNKSHSRPPSIVQKLSVIGQLDEIGKIIDENSKYKILNFQTSMEIIKNSGIDIVPYQYIQKKSHQHSVIKFPVVAKIASDTITHKTEVKGVLTHITDTRTLNKTIKNFLKIKNVNGVYVQSQQEGLEIFLGAKRDSAFGIIIVLGIGGIYTELIRQTSFVIHPVSLDEFKTIIKNDPFITKYFSGYRNLPVVNLETLWKVSLSLGYLMETFNRISVVDINPLFATQEGLIAADARIVLR